MALSSNMWFIMTVKFPLWGPGWRNIPVAQTLHAKSTGIALFLYWSNRMYKTEQIDYFKTALIHYRMGPDSLQDWNGGSNFIDVIPSRALIMHLKLTQYVFRKNGEIPPTCRTLKTTFVSIEWIQQYQYNWHRKKNLTRWYIYDILSVRKAMIHYFLKDRPHSNGYTTNSRGI